MKRTNFLKVCAIAFAAVTAFVSCDKFDTTTDPSDNPVTEPEVVNVLAKCNFKTSQDMLDFFDITYIYALNGEEGKKETLKETELNIVKKYEKGNFPEKITFKVVATPKKDHKAIDEAGRYKIIDDHTMSVGHMVAEGKAIKAFYRANANSKTLSGKNFLGYIAKEWILVNHTYTPDQAH